MTTRMIASPRLADDSYHSIAFGLSDPLTDPLTVNRACKILMRQAQNQTGGWAVRAAIMLRGLAMAVDLHLHDPAIRFPGYVSGEVPDDDDARWGTWTRRDDGEMERLGLQRSDWSAVFDDIPDPDSVLFLSCVPAAVDGYTSVLIALACNGDLLTLFTALHLLALEPKHNAVRNWHEALRLLAFMGRMAGKLEPTILPAVAAVATDDSAWDEPEEAEAVLRAAITTAREVWAEDENSPRVKVYG